jgi:glycerol-3-phosphate dehydrogenase subunit B
MSIDVVVIGGGLSGAMAALRAASQKKKVALLRQGWGATAFLSGACNISEKSESIRHALTFFKENVELDLKGSFDESFSFLTEQGRLQKSSHVLASHFNVIPDNPNAASAHPDVTVTSPNVIPASSNVIPAHPNVIPRLDRGIQKNLLVMGISPFYPFSDKTFPVKTAQADWINSEVNLLPPMIAKRLDDLSNVRALANKMKVKVKSHSFQSLLVPPVLGIEHADEVRSELEKQLGVPVFELLAGVPSVPGIRFQKALDRALLQANVDITQGAITKIDAENRHINAVNGMEASQFILATGKFLGGGILRQGSFQETVFGLPVFSDEASLFSAGIRVNEYNKPINQRGHVVFENLKACGTVIAGHSIHGESHFGADILSGYHAGDMAE